MKVLIVGTGVIGVVYGWALSEAGDDVTHFVRAGRAERCQAGFQLDMLDERRGHPKYSTPRYVPTCVEAIEVRDGYELVIVATNAYQVEDAIQALSPAAGDAVFLVFSGNWDGPEGLDRLLSRSRYLLGYPDGGGTVRDDGVYWTNLGSEVHLGGIEGNPIDVLERVKAMFERANMKPDMQKEILHWLWLHNASVVGYAAAFAKYRDIDISLADKALLREGTLATKEIFALCRRRGVSLKGYPEHSYIRFPTWLITVLLRRNFRRNESMQRYTAHASSEDSLRETRFHYDAILRTADEVSLEMPHLKALGAYLPTA